MEQFITIKENSKTEITVKKSKFIAEVFYIEEVEEAEKIIQAIKKREHNAKHYCYAYRIAKDNIIEKMSDDGEPSGTAGGPMLAILQGKKLLNILVVVTRYFGGILLGTGGLVRAYSDATTCALEKAQSKIIQKGAEISLDINYSDFETFKKYLNSINGKILYTEYEDNIKVLFQIPESSINTFINNYQNLPFLIKNQKKVKEKFVDI